jgi:hypothetical protein
MKQVTQTQPLVYPFKVRRSEMNTTANGSRVLLVHGKIQSFSLYNHQYLTSIAQRQTIHAPTVEVGMAALMLSWTLEP